MKRDRSEYAGELFLSGYNCTQSVVLSFADDLKFSRELAHKIAAGFGGGMGKQQDTCGAVTGSIMMLGMMIGERVNSNDKLLSESYSAVKELNREFVKEFGTTRCKDLIGCDLNTSEGSAEFMDKKIKETVCVNCVKRAVQIVESLIS